MIIELFTLISGASLVAQTLNNLPAMWETRVWSLGWEDSLGKGMAIHSSILAWRTPRTEEPGELQFMGSQRTGRDWGTNTFQFQTSICCFKHRQLANPRKERTKKRAVPPGEPLPSPWEQFEANGRQGQPAPCSALALQSAEPWKLVVKLKQIRHYKILCNAPLRRPNKRLE